MAETQVTGRQIKDKSVFDADIDLSSAPTHPSLVASDRFVIIDPTDGAIKTSTLANLYTGLDLRYLLLTGGTITGNLIVSGTTTLNSVIKFGTSVISNLNADLLDGYHASNFSPTSHSHNFTDGILDGNGLLYQPYPVQPAYSSTPATGVFYSETIAPNSVGSVNYSGTMRAYVFNADAVWGGNHSVLLGSAGVTQLDSEYGIYHGSGDQIIALMGRDQGIDTYVYAGGQLIYNSFYFYLGDYVMSPRFHSTIGTGTMPIQVSSTTLCTNLNADLLDGNHSSAFALSSHTHSYEPPISPGTIYQYWRGDKSWQTFPAFPTVSAENTQVLFMNGTSIQGAPGFQYKPATGDFSAGILAEASGGNSCAIGTGSFAVSDGCVAIGFAADSEGANSICIGSYATTFSNYCVILGVEASSSADNAIAIGRGAIAENAGDISLGSSTYNGKSTIYGNINFPTLTSTGFLKISGGLVSVHMVEMGTVTSVGLSMPTMFNITGSPVTSSGTLTASLVSQTKNFVLVAPQFANGVPSFRKLTADDMPDLSAMYDNYYCWNVKVNSGTTFQMLKAGSATFSGAYNALNLIAGTGISITESSIVGGALGITINSSATVSGNEFTMIGRNTMGYGVYSELNSSTIMRLISNNSGSDLCEVFDATGAWSRRDIYVTTGGSNVNYTGQTLTDITGLAIILGAYSTYEYEAILSVQTSAVSTGIQYAIAYSAGYSQFSGQIIGSVNTSYSRGNVLAINTASSTFISSSGQTGQILIKGYIKTSGIGGTLSIKHLKVTSGTSTVLPYSYFRVNLISTQ